MKSKDEAKSHQEKHPDALLYSKLKFHNGPKTLKLNAMGANYRSRKHDMPFGDQGICIKKESFNELGGYREDVKFGEDYHFVEDAKVQNIAIRSTGGTLETSGEKYQGQLVRRTLTVKGMLGRLQEERKNLSPLAPIISHNGAANDVAEELTGLDEPTLDHATSQDSQVPPPHGGKNQKISPEKMPQNSTKPANNRPEQRGTERNL